MMFIFLLFSATALRTTVNSGESAELSVPAFDSVLTMLQNLIQQIEAEEVSDQQDYDMFKAWFTRQADATSSSIGMLSTRLQELAAIIADLRSRQHSLTGEVARLNGEVDETQRSIQAAQAKRILEHENFVKEQLDFDNSIAACGKAVELLQKHYGDGTPKESTKPAWMALIQTLKLVRSYSSHMKADKEQHAHKMIESFLQQTPGMRGSTMHDEHQDSTGEALGIVAQVQTLGETFAEDKQSSVDQEQELTEAFNTLMAQKSLQLSTLIQQRDAQQAILTQVNQELGENENAEATAKATLQDEQAYLSAIQQQDADTENLYHQRVHDRAQEKEAVNMALGVLSQENPAFMQVSRSRRVRKSRVLPRLVSLLRQPKDSGCLECHVASQMLQKMSKRLHSELLATAAMTTGSGEALVPVIGQLNDLITRLDEQQRGEQEHKEWCEHELTETAKTKSHHEQLVAGLKSDIEDDHAIIAEKKQTLADTLSSIETGDKEYEEGKALRAKAKADYDAEHADYVDSISALNQAIDILADFYRESQEELLQTQQVPVPGAASRAAAPVAATMAGGYVKKGGGHVVNILKQTRQDFEVGKKSLEDQETQEIADFAHTTETYTKTRADLVDAGNRLNAELQGASIALAQHQTDLAENEDKVNAAIMYLSQVGGSCTMLIDNFETRTKLRADEKQAIQDAIGVLQQAAR